MRRDTRRILTCAALGGGLVWGCTQADMPGSGPNVDTGQVQQPLLWPQTAMIPAPEVGSQYMRFGWAVAINGDRAIVGAPSETGSGLEPPIPTGDTRQGQAYVFIFQNGAWVQDARLLAPVRQDFERFGISVGIDGNYAVVAADLHVPSGQATATGTAYVFERDGSGNWNVVDQLFPEAPAGAGQFGSCTDVEGTRMVVGAQKVDRGFNDTGEAYIYERDDIGGTWSQVARLEPSDKAASDQFGINCRVSGDRVVVGAFHNSNLKTGAAYVFERQSNGSWLEVGNLVGSDSVGGDHFGNTVDISGTTVVAGTRFYREGGVAVGKAYVFEPAVPEGGVLSGPPYTWVEKQLRPADGRPAFGANVAVSGDRILVGASLTSNSAYVFQKTGGEWLEERQILPNPALVGNESFGLAVGLSGTRAVVGAAYTGNPTSSGTAYFYEAAEPIALGQACTEGQRCDSGFCEDGVCCQSACGTCQACVQSKTGQPDGTCAPIPTGQDPDNECTDPVCVAGVQTGDECDGVGACNTSGIECGAFACAAAGDVCNESCTGAAECAADAFCDTANNVCQGTRVNGDACSVDNQCVSNNCVDGVCCNSACTNQCEACDATGTCVAITGAPRGSRPACTGEGTVCGGSCDGTNRVACAYPGSDITCDPSVCTDGTVTSFTCDQGTCASTDTSCGGFVCADGAACRTECADNAECADGFVCEESSCIAVTAAPSCSDDRTEALDAEGNVVQSCSPYYCTNAQCGTSCSSSVDCQEGFVCDRARRACRRSTPPSPSELVGFLCAVSGVGRTSNGTGALLAVAGTAVALLRRRRSSRVSAR